MTVWLEQQRPQMQTLLMLRMLLTQQHPVGWVACEEVPAATAAAVRQDSAGAAGEAAAG